MRGYLDTSAAAKLLVEEAESEALARMLDDDWEPVATHLLETELRRFAHRHGIAQGAVSAILDRVAIHDLPASVYREAGLLPGASLRSLDALHLIGAIRTGSDAVITYDDRLAAAAADVGLAVAAPGSI